VNFWKKLPKGFIGLAPMDGVTDALYRYIYSTYTDKPDVIFTEFTSVEGIAHNAIKLLKDFDYREEERPIVAQVFGLEPESFYVTAVIVAQLGFDGIDINMGCPAKKVYKRGSGAGLIATPSLASEIIEAVQKGVQDYYDGKVSLEDFKMKQKMKAEILSHIEKHPNIEKKLIPVSVKTRMGLDEIITTKWISHLKKHNLAAITLHGRTLKQMYSGEANWEEIAKAKEILSDTDTILIGNGDVQNKEDAKIKIKKYNVDGALIGRASFGNPWVFTNHTPTQEDKIKLAIHHSQEFEKWYGKEFFFIMRKNLLWYTKGFPNAKEVRKHLVRAENSKDIEGIFNIKSQ